MKDSMSREHIQQWLSTIHTESQDASGSKTPSVSEARQWLRELSPDQVTLEEVRTLAAWFWKHGARVSTVRDPFVPHHENPRYIEQHDRQWMAEAFAHASDQSAERQIFAVIACWNRLPTRMGMLLPTGHNENGYFTRKRAIHDKEPDSFAAQALGVSDDPAWWRLCLEHEVSLADTQYEARVRELCARLLPTHSYVSVAQSLDTSLHDVLGIAPSVVAAMSRPDPVEPVIFQGSSNQTVIRVGPPRHFPEPDISSVESSFSHS